VPPLEVLQPATCYLGWKVTLRTTADENAIRDVFVFVEDGAELSIAPIEDSLLNAGTEKSNAANSADAPLRSEQSADSASRTQGEHQELAAKPQAKTLSKESVVRVPSNRLDRLVNLVGELVMNQSRLMQAAMLAGTPELANPV
jgi:two-component system chemotaxis sensor kinase CheA